MFGVGIGSVGDIYAVLLIYCLLLSINLKLGAAFARSRGWQDWVIPKLRLLWPLVTLVLIVVTVAFSVGVAQLSPPIILSQIAGCLLLATSVGAMFYFLATGTEQRRGLTLSRIGAVATLSTVSIVLSAGICALYLIAKYSFLTGLFLLALYSTKFK
jgi:hypothetical protein